MDKGARYFTMPLVVEGKVVRHLPVLCLSPNATIKHVTYDQLLQQLCKDFLIEYLWYDKVCIDQSNKDAKLQEIKQMHRIYSNACYTVAIVPEVHVFNPKYLDTINPVFAKTQAFWKRSWTLEEAMSSKRILIVGTDTNLWQHSLNTCNIPTTADLLSAYMLDFVNQHQGGGSVNQALHYAHFRKSAKEHDKIFSLINIFHDMFEDMKIDYKMDIKTAFSIFYQMVASKDLSILCFGGITHNDGSRCLESTMKDHSLPTWTGVSGVHIVPYVTTTVTLFQSPYFICDDMSLHIPTKYYKKLPIVPFDFACFSPLASHDKEQWRQQQTMFKERQESMGVRKVVAESTALMDWSIVMYGISNLYATHYHHPQDTSFMKIRPLSLTEDCNECVILPVLLKSHDLAGTDIGGSTLLNQRAGYNHNYYLPVIKKYMDNTNSAKEQYKAIGIYFLGGPHFGELSSDDPNEILYSVFGDVANNEVKEFIIN
ncbi:hypothetical protein BDA99DRAFT_537674 [Phascolomyces articulosus]|uniref:Heterokaryon incompatibility domain-containing protein n=1 Tax=Phascolomyces articulosus TaxID=60185 RepID=A0AAD5JZZ0_9FUNG|nr:hypothetical protein BDA99DRAFT_537674 [Phascolomyces articulosus]